MKKMKKVLFWMFLLFLLGLGTAGLKAQVRIGSNTPPNASAVLDLNANDTNSGTLGLALPRVALTSNTMLLSGVTSNLTGMMVYNTSTAGGTGVNTMGIYYWNGTNWIQASLPSTSAADSGKVLISNGSTWVPSNVTPAPSIVSSDAFTLHTGGIGFSIAMILDTIYTFSTQVHTGAAVSIAALGLFRDDVCFANAATVTPSTPYNSVIASASSGALLMRNTGWYNINSGDKIRVRCLRLVS